MPGFELKGDNGNRDPHVSVFSDAYKTPSEVSNIPQQLYISWPKTHLEEQILEKLTREEKSVPGG